MRDGDESARGGSRPDDVERAVVGPGVGGFAAEGLAKLARDSMRQFLGSRTHLERSVAEFGRDEFAFGLGGRGAARDVGDPPLDRLARFADIFSSQNQPAAAFPAFDLLAGGAYGKGTDSPGRKASLRVARQVPRT